MRHRFLIFSIFTFCLAMITQVESRLHTMDAPGTAHETHILNTQGKISASDAAELNLPRPYTGISRVPRNASQARRTTLPITSGFASVKSGKQMNHHSEIIFINSLQLFASGLSKATNHLISLGKLII